MNTSVKYYEKDSWSIGESFFNKEWLGKYEAILSLGNGYMGLRSATEENYIGEKRNTFIAGTFNKFDDNEVTELPNVPDMLQINIKINGQLLDLSSGSHSNYERKLNLRSGELIRQFIWTTPNKEQIEFEFKRIVSFKRRHVFGQEVTITPLTDNVSVEIESGIDGQLTNSGSQHFTEGDKHLYNEKYIQMTPKTTESKIDFVLTTVHNFYKQEKSIDVKSRVEMKRRKITNLYWLNIYKGESVTIEKISNIHTTRDKEHHEKFLNEISDLAYKELECCSMMGYKSLAVESADEWEKKVWSVAPITIQTDNSKDQLSINFAKYHLHVMTPAHDNRMNIGAKGLSGEGYKGHTFWDTEVFILPYYTYTHPEIAKSLLEFRYFGLEGAHKKAESNGYYGAQYPWEAAWIEDGETTPIWGAADIVTGKATKILSGFIEQHITSDVAYGVNQYSEATGDREFMTEKGYEIILDTAKFWASRLEYDELKDRYYINDVIGPDEYKEHVNNNAYTNYTAYWNMKKALQTYEYLKDQKPETFDCINKKIDLNMLYRELSEKSEKLYLPISNENNVLPQDDMYLSKKIIDLTPYKSQGFVGGLFHDYNLEQVNDMQITKQADVMLLLYLFEDMFTQEEKEANWAYYEPKTIHDSSLSLSTHSTLAADLGNTDLSYEMFKKASNIDLGPEMNSSDDGVHAASLGGIWQTVVFGYGGVRALDGKLRINPNLPKTWNQLNYSVFWHKNELQIEVTKNQLIVINKTRASEVEFETFGELYRLEDKVIIDLVGIKLSK